MIAVTFNPLSEATWPDLQVLFGLKGACGGCWCMTPRLPAKLYNECKGEKNKQLLHNLIRDGQPLGIIAYHEKTPIGWCSVSPKDNLLSMKPSRLMNHTETKNVWSVVCLFIAKEFRRKGISSLLISGAVEYAFNNGADHVEAYPSIPKIKSMPDVFAWMGIEASYKKAGFRLLKKLSDSRVIMMKSRI
jgi:GNAT superfamily N-acetyltransferase